MQSPSAKFFMIATLLAALAVFLGCSSTSPQNPSPSVSSKNFSLKVSRFGHALVNDGKYIYVMGGSGESGFLSDIEIINPETKEIIHLKNKLIPRRYHSAVWDGKHSIYILGGLSKTKRGTRIEPTVEVFNIATQEVSRIEDMPTPRRLGSAVYLDDRIIVSGGSIVVGRKHKKFAPTSTVSIYNIALKKWQAASDLPTPKETRTVLHNGSVYAVGGYNGQSGLNSLERFNLARNEWQAMPPSPKSLSAHSLVALGDKLITFGDYTDLDSNYAYDFHSHSWQKLELGYLPGRHNAATVLNGKVYVIGGTTGTRGAHLNHIQVLEFVIDETSVPRETHLNNFQVFEL